MSNKVNEIKNLIINEFEKSGGVFLCRGGQVVAMIPAMKANRISIVDMTTQGNDKFIFSISQNDSKVFEYILIYFDEVRPI